MPRIFAGSHATNCQRSTWHMMRMTSYSRDWHGREHSSAYSRWRKFALHSLTINSSDFVIPSGARDLHFAANCRSLASLGMTIYEGIAQSAIFATCTEKPVFGSSDVSSNTLK